MKNCIEIKNLTKTYSKFQLKNINLKIPNGSIVGLVGENGAGKTTLMKLILNLIGRDQGSISVFQQDNLTEEVKIKKEIGLVMEGAFFPDMLCPKDISKIMNQLYKNWDETLFYQYLERFELPKDKIMKQYSKGMKMKLQIVTALSHHPKLLLLDEPTSGLDPVVRSEILDLFLEFIQEEDHTVFLSTHITSDLEHIADYIVFIDHGEIILQKEKDQLLEEYGILKCDEKTFQTIPKEEIVRYRKERYQYEILVENRKKWMRKDGIVVDHATIETIMVLYVKGMKK